MDLTSQNILVKTLIQVYIFIISTFYEDFLSQRSTLYLLVYGVTTCWGCYCKYFVYPGWKLRMYTFPRRLSEWVSKEMYVHSLSSLPIPVKPENLSFYHSHYTDARSLWIGHQRWQTCCDFSNREYMIPLFLGTFQHSNFVSRLYTFIIQCNSL